MNSADFSLISDYVSIDASEQLSKAIELFKRNIREILVFDKNTFLGYLTKRHLAHQSRINPETKVSSLAFRVPTVRKGDPLNKIAQAILSAKIRSVPVEKEGEIIGVIKDIDVIRASQDIFEGKKVKDVMTREPICVSPKTTVAKLIATTRTHNISRSPVIDENNKLVGIVSPHDIINILLKELPEQTLGDRSAGKFNPLELEVKNIMTDEVITVMPNDSVSEAIIKLYETDHKALVVVDDNFHPVGIITTRDLLEIVSRPPKTEGYYIRVIGDVDEEDIEQVVEMAVDLVKKYSSAIGTSGQLFVHAKAIPKKKFRGFSLYQVRLRIASDKGRVYVARADGYGVFSALAVALDRIEREIVSERELEIQYRQQPRTKHKLLEELEEI